MKKYEAVRRGRPLPFWCGAVAADRCQERYVGTAGPPIMKGSLATKSIGSPFAIQPAQPKLAALIVRFPAVLNRTGSDGGSGYWIPTKGWSVRFVA